MDKNHNGTEFRFKNNDRVGEAAAEADDKFLFDCFIDNGALEVLRDCNAPQSIIVGRTGSGKSALLRTLINKEEHVISLAPEQLALSYLSNSEVIKFFENAGANLDLFYQLLWRHVLAVELVKNKYKITNDLSQKTFLQSLEQIFFKDKAKEQAVNYLRTWGENFWNETEYRIKEITGKIEKELKDSLSAGALGVKLETTDGNKLSSEEKQEVINRGARVVNQVQIKALAEVIRLLADEIFNDDQESYFIVIDDLDTKWVDDPLKYKLIRALIETIRTFRQIKNVKIIVAIRQDLLQRVITATRDSGFQSEKYASLYYKLRWNKPQIINLLNKRISFLVKQRYTTKSVPLEDLLPRKIGQTSCIDYIIERTFLRPRDAILFVNECIERAADKGTINTSMVYEAEGAYSQSRIDSLQEEWNTIYPRVSDYLRIFTRRPAKQKISDFSPESINEWLIDTLLLSQDLTDPVVKSGNAFINESKNSNFRFLLTLFEALYTVGAVGIKPDTGNTENWSFYSDYTPSEGSLKPSSVISLHPTFWRAIGARDAT